MSDELMELQENAEHGAHEKTLAPVTITMAVLAVFVAAISLLGHRAHTEELLNQTRSTDQWAYYQAKDIRLRAYEVFLDQLSVTPVQDAAKAGQLKDKYEKAVQTYAQQEKQIEEQAKDAEIDVTTYGRRADRFDFGEVMLEAALVICSITLLTKKRVFWGFGLLLGVIGIGLGVAGLLVR
ncbi:MAG TPA: DUF4337 domain-containing protein [Candidatus Aquilonibacter sp.]|nr:DUF4337 domain-containing protein [Candidatus Aquilonibacter sp.]